MVNWNDDACTDIIANATVLISPCNGSAPGGFNLPNTPSIALDWDGDGRTDLLANVSGTWEVFRSEGNAVAPEVAANITLGTGTYVVTDQNGDGLSDLVFANSAAGYAIDYGLHNGAGQPPDLATSFVDGFGNSVSPTYLSIADGGYGYNLADQQYPYVVYVGPLYVVSQFAASDGAGGTYTNSLYYYDAYMNVQGRGFAGFWWKNTTDSRNATNRVEYYVGTFPDTGMKYEDILQQPSGTISQVVNTPNNLVLDSTANNQRYYPYITSSVSTQYEVSAVASENGQLITSTSINYGTPDNYGNFDSVTTTVTDEDANSPYHGDTWTSTTVNTIAPNTSDWCLNLPTETTVTQSSTAPGGTAIERTVTYTPDYAHCNQTGRVIEPNSATYKMTEAYGYDGFGNLNSDTVTGVGMSARSTTINWGTTGQFPTTVTNALSQSMTAGYDPNTGMKTRQTDLNGLATTWQYDDFARKAKETRPDGTYTQWTYNDCTQWGGCLYGPHALAVAQYVYGANGSLVTDGSTYFDTVDRPIIANKELLAAGSYDRNEVRYDSLGRVSQQSAPCLWTSVTTTCPYWTTYHYDTINRLTSSQRPISASNPNPQTTTYGYAGRTSTVQDPLGHTTTKITQVTGNLGRSQGPNGYYQSFTYDAFGSLLSVTDSASPANTLFTAKYSYGIGAFQTSSTDMDLGVRSYTVDALGEVRGYTDAKGQSFSMTYDALSRPLARTEPDLTTTWTWGATKASDNLGQLQSVTAASAAGTWSDTYTYDTLGRPSTETISNPGDRTYEYIKTYDPTTGLLSSLQYPVDISFILTLQYAYSNGILKSVSSTSYSPTEVYWTANTTNARGQVTQETYGNGVVKTLNYDAVTGWLGSLQAGPSGGATLQNNSYAYDDDGNLTQRQDNNRGLTENFYYDTMNRLDHSTLNGVTNLQMAYDTTGMGNIASRSDVAGGATWTYDPVRKHAVTQAGSAAYTYAYDANGNMSSRNGYTLGWSSYNLPTSVSSAGESVTFAYDGNHQRWQEVYTGGPNGLETTYHAGKLFEVANYGGLANYRQYIYAGNELVAVDDRSTQAQFHNFVVTDHQGSIAAFETGGSPASNDVPESFTAFGNRRNGETWSGAPTSSDETAIGIVTRRGYTGETTLGVSMGLNHLNGRVEDSITGRFLSPDPYVPDPDNTQSFNRYSYVNNNPLSFTDTSGFDLDPITVNATLGGPENPIADVASGIVGILDLGDLFGWFGGGGPTLSPMQQAAEAHGINLSSPLQGAPSFQSAGGTSTLPTQVVVSSVPATQGQIASFGFAGFNASINSPGALNTAARNGVGDMSDTSPGSINAFDAHPNFDEIEVDAIRGGGFNYAGIGRSAAFLAAAPWMKLAAIGVIGTSGAYVGGNLLGPELAVAPMVRTPPPDLGVRPPGWNSNWEFRLPEGGGNYGPRWFDEEGGEWRFHDIDSWHDIPHWDYNPWNQWNSPWQNIYP